MADVLHMQTIHHLGYAELAEGVRVGLQRRQGVRAGARAVGSLQRAGIRDL